MTSAFSNFNFKGGPVGIAKRDTTNNADYKTLTERHPSGSFFQQYLGVSANKGTVANGRLSLVPNGMRDDSKDKLGG
jgi:hypothetical protein